MQFIPHNFIMKYWYFSFHSFYFILLISSPQIHPYYLMLLFFIFCISSLNNSDFQIHPSWFHPIQSPIWNEMVRNEKVKGEICQDEMVICKVRMKHVDMKWYLTDIGWKWGDEMVKEGPSLNFCSFSSPNIHPTWISSRHQRWSL